MPNKDIRTVAVIGAGTVGSQIAILCALAGYKTYLQDMSDTRLKRAQESMQFQMRQRVRKKSMTETEYKMVLARLNMATDLHEAVWSADLVIEAGIETADESVELFAKLDRMAPWQAILAAGSSVIFQSNKISKERLDKVCRMHFFNPPLTTEIVEIETSEKTSEQTANATADFVNKLGKTPMLLRKGSADYIKNRMLGALVREALDLLEEGVATQEEIEAAVKDAIGHPFDPFALMDLK